MRRILGFVAVVAVLFTTASCSDLSESLLPDMPGDGSPSNLEAAGQIFDGTAEGGNPYFFFLNPFSKSKLKPNQMGTFDQTLQPDLTICAMNDWNDSTVPENCSEDQALASFGAVANDFGDLVELVLSAEKYQVVFKSQNYPMAMGTTYRVTISIYGKTLGWADMALYNPDDPAHDVGAGKFTADDILLLNGNENQNISFRIDEGALENEFCDPDGSGVEDCDVAIVDPNQGYVLRVFDDGRQNSAPLGAIANIPTGIYGPDGQLYTKPFPLILELEYNDQPQYRADIPVDRQVPYFIDIWTPELGLYFDENGPGVEILLCQEQTSGDIGFIDEALHRFLVLFLVKTGPDGYPVTELLPTEVGDERCAGFDPSFHTAAHDGGQTSLLSRVAAGVTKATRFFLPKPLFARRRLHGGLNTVVWEISGDSKTRSSAQGVTGLALAGGEPEPLEFGAFLNVDADSTTAAAVVPNGVVGDPTDITLQVLDALNRPFLFEVGVKVVVSGANNPDTITAVYNSTDSIYTASYTPTNSGTDTINFVIGPEDYLDETIVGPFPSLVSPVAPSAANTTFGVSYSEAGGSTTVTVTVKDEDGNPYLDGEFFPIQVAIKVESGETVVYDLLATDEDGTGTFDGIYTASFTPDVSGAFEVYVLIGGTATSDSPKTVKTQPRPADAGQSQIVVADGQVESETPVSVVVKNTLGEAYTYGAGFTLGGDPDFARPITVTVTVSGANSATFVATDPDLDGTYTGAYTPLNPGMDYIDAVISDALEGDASVAQATSDVAPLSGPFTVQVNIAGPAEAYDYGLPVWLFRADGSRVDDGTVTTTEAGLATFADVEYGFSYTVFLPKRDFDVQFTGGAEQTLFFDKNSGDPTVTFNATSVAVPASVLVYRVGYDYIGGAAVYSGGSGNAFEYTVGGRSWTSASNQVRDYFLTDGEGSAVDGHLATLTDQGENDFVQSFFTRFDNLCPGVTNPKQCKYKGWIGLTDEVVEGTYEWVTGEPFEFTAWIGGSTPDDRRGNQDYVEIDFEGKWGISNGASTTNEGYFTEWEAAQPDAPDFS